MILKEGGPSINKGEKIQKNGSTKGALYGTEKERPETAEASNSKD